MYNFNLLISYLLILVCISTSVGSQTVANYLLKYRVTEEQPMGTTIADDVMKRVRHLLLYDDRVKVTLTLVEGRTDLIGLDRVGEDSVRLVTLVQLDRESVCPTVLRDINCVISLRMAAQSESHLQIFIVEVALADINDNVPTFQRDKILWKLHESAPIGSFLRLPLATDADSGNNSVTGYELTGARPSIHPFRLVWSNWSSPDAGQTTTAGGEILRLELVGELDREREAGYHFNVTAFDGGLSSLTSTLSVDVSVTDVNDNRPKFDKDRYEATVSSRPAPGSLVARVTAVDPDEGLNGQILYSFSRRTQTQSGHVFHVDPITGVVTVSRRYEVEELLRQTVHNLVIVAADQGENSLPTSTVLSVKVSQQGSQQDPQGQEEQRQGRRGNKGQVTESANKLTVQVETIDGNNRTATVAENNPPGTFLAHLTILSSDPDSVIHCTVVPPSRSDAVQSESRDLFSVVPLYGTNDFKLVATQSLDREQQSRYLVKIECVNRLSNPPPTSSAVVMVTVSDVDDNLPIFTKSVYECTLTENNERGAFLVQVSASDADVIDQELDREPIGRAKNTQQELVYRLDSDAENKFRIDTRSGKIYALDSFDYETAQQVEFHVIAYTRPRAVENNRDNTADDRRENPASGNSALTSRSLVRVTLLNIDDEVPRFTRPWYKFEVKENLGSGTQVGVVTAIDRDQSHAGPVLYSFEDDLTSPDGSQFALDPHTGMIYTRRPLDRETLSHYTLRVRAVSGNHSDTAVVFITVTDSNDNTPTFLFPSPDGSSVWRLRDDKMIMASAVDKDEGRNAELTYSVASTSSDVAFFDIDKTSGMITYRHPQAFSANIANNSVRSNSTVTRCPIKLTVVVRDLGTYPPGPLFSRADLTVVPEDCHWMPVNREAVPRSDSADERLVGGILSQTHILIIAGILGGCAVLTVLIVAAVCIIRHRTTTSSNQSVTSRLNNDIDKSKGAESADEGGATEAEAILLFDRNSDGESTGRAIVVYVKDPDGLRGAESLARFQLRPISDSGGSNLYISRGVRRRAESDDSNLYVARSDRDTDSGYLDVASV